MHKILLLIILGLITIVIGIFSLYVKVKLKYPTTDDEYTINTDIGNYDKNCIFSGKVDNYLRTSDNLIYTELIFHSNCTSPVGFVIRTDSEIINSYSVPDGNTIPIKSNKTSDNVYLYWFNATNKGEDFQPHIIQIFTTTKNLFSNRYRVVSSDLKLSKVTLSYDEWKYFCESDCFLAFTSIESDFPIGRQGTMRFKQFIPKENAFLVGFYPSSTKWLFFEFLSFSLTAGLILEIIHILIEGNLRKKQNPEKFRG
jgi:hypothetical protein